MNCEPDLSSEACLLVTGDMSLEDKRLIATNPRSTSALLVDHSR
jgi:hypothetical protein